MSLSPRRPEPFGSSARPPEPDELLVDGTFPPTDARRFVRREEPVMDASFSGAVFMALCAAGLLALLGLVLLALGLGAISGALVV